MRTNDNKTLSGPVAEELTPLEISQAVLEGEENPNPARAITPLERAASGGDVGEGRRRSRLGRILLNPAVLGGAAVTGVGLIAAMLYARRTPRSAWRALDSFRPHGARASRASRA